MSLKQKVLEILITNAVSIMPGASVFPPWILAKFLKASKNDVRKCLKELVTEGLVQYGYEGGWNEYYERPYCTWGYYITRKAMDLPEYKEAERREHDYIVKSLRRN